MVIGFLAVFLLLLVPFHHPLQAQAASTVTARLGDLLRVAVEIESEDLDIKLGISALEVPWLSRLTLVHPVIALGTLERGRLIRLIDSGIVDWSAVPATAGVGMAEQSNSPEDDYRIGLRISPFPRRLSFFAFEEPDLALVGVLFSGELQEYCSWLLLSTYSRPVSGPVPDSWLFEIPVSRITWLAHVLGRISFEKGPLSLVLGYVASSAPAAGPGVRLVSSVGFRNGPLLLGAGFGISTRGYLGTDGGARLAPVRFYWHVATEPPSLTFRHSVEIEPLPLLQIPYRATEEILEGSFSLSKGLFSYAAEASIQISGDRTGGQTIATEGTLSFALEQRGWELGIHGRVTQRTDGELASELVLPVRGTFGDTTITAEGGVSNHPYVGWRAAVGVSCELSEGGRWFAEIRTRDPVPMDMELDLTKLPARFTYSCGWSVDGKLQAE